MDSPDSHSPADQTNPARRAIPPQASESRWRAPDGAAIRRIDWAGRRGDSQPPRGSILFLPGRADFYEKYLETLDGWHAAGWRVTALDWRWQAGSGRYHDHPRVGGVDDFASWIKDLGDFWGPWAAATPGPHVLIAHSMGGHLALRAVATRAVRPDALVLTAPMLGFVTPIPKWLQPGFAWAMCTIANPDRMAWGDGERPGDSAATRGKTLTHDADRYADEGWWRKQRPELDLGPASWDWVRKAGESIAVLDRPGLLESVAVPVQILAARYDLLVAWPAIARAAARLPGAELVDFGREAAHELLREADPVRNRVLAAIAAFCDRVAPPDEPA
ncbi:alpha/beta hydrolase [Novosphingobium sp.]|uniref:alpha/beta hydrolase n=1 Tax=Novosphingobium sp. TaxID=1874826 RepID=UPI00333E9671